MLEGSEPVRKVETELGACVYPLIPSLFERFGVTGISAEFVTSELARMRTNRFGDYSAESKG
jgi:hypothetical protein